MVIGLLFAVLALNAHPLHTTITELTEDRSRGVVRATIRVFGDDFGKARGKMPELDYVMSKFSFADRAGRPRK